MRILYYSSGVTGSGRIVPGISLYNGLKRRGLPFEYCILSSTENTGFIDPIPHREIPIEDQAAYDREHYKSSHLFKSIVEFKPDLLIVELMWITLHHFIRELPCKKIFVTRLVYDHFFRFQDERVSMSFEADAYDRVIAIEPYPCPVTDFYINPLVVRNRDEILSRGEALRRLKLDPKKKYCLFSLNLPAAELADSVKMYSYLEDEGYTFFFSSLFEGGLFPVADYFNAFDLVICGAGYSAFWEAVYFKKETIFLPQPKVFESQRWRVDNCLDHEFDVNGADQLAEIIEEL